MGTYEDIGESRTKRPGFPVDLFRIKRALWRHRKLLGASLVLGLVVGYLFAKLLMPSLYETTVVLKYEGDLRVGDLNRGAGYALGPAADALRRDSVLSKIRDELGYEGSLDWLSAAIEYQPDFRAGTLTVITDGDTAEEAASLAHLVTDVFLAYHRDRQARRIEEEIARVTTRIEGAEQEAEDALRKYNEFRDRHGIAHLSTEQQSMIDSTARMRADSELARSEIRALEAQVQSLETQLQTIPKTSVVVGETSPERAAYNRLRQELASARASLSDSHPRVQALQQQVEQLRGSLRSGGGGGLVGSNATYRNVQTELREAKSKLTTLTEREKGLSRMADEAQRRVESFSGIEGQASGLLAEVEVNQALVASLTATEAALEDALEDPPSGFSVLDPGTVPEEPVANRAKLFVFLFIAFLTVVAALGWALGREFRGLRMLTPSEVAFWGNGPVVGVTQWPSDRHGLDELVAGLDDFAPDSRGRMLIVAGSPSDSALATELAQRMNDDWFLDRGGVDPDGNQSVATPAPTPIQTAPPSGPYPIGGSGGRQSAAPARPSTALALRPVKLVRRVQELELDAWNGPFEGQALRRAARLADRVMVLVRSGDMSAIALNAVRRRIGREEGVGYVVLALPDELVGLPDRAGPVAEFWGREG